MSTLTFDTLSASEVLIQGDLTQKQATAITKVIKEAQDSHLEELSTKGDLLLVRKDVLLSEQRLLLRLGSLIVAMTGLNLAFMQLGGISTP